MSPSTTSQPHKGRVAVVTGASRGIGQAVAVELARRGARVVIGARSDQGETVKLVAEVGGESWPAMLDVSDPASVEACRAQVEAEIGHVDILINNAATFEVATWDDLDFELWQHVMSVNLNGPMLMCKAVLPMMRGRGWGRIVNVSSASVAIATGPISASLDRMHLLTNAISTLRNVQAAGGNRVVAVAM